MSTKMGIIFALVLFIGFGMVISEAAAEITNNSGSASDSSSTSFSSTGNWFSFTNIEQSKSTIYSRERVVYPPNYKLDPGFIAPLPAHYKDENWVIWVHPFFHSHGITKEMMDRLRHSRLKQYVSVWATTENKADTVMPLREYPRGDDILELGYVQVEGRDNAPEEEAVMEAVYHANEKTGTGNVLIMKRHKLITTGSVLSFGAVLNAYGAVGPSGKVDETLVTGGGGSGIGRSKSYVDRNPVFRVICFNKAGEVRPAPIPAKPLPPAEYYVSKHTPIFFAFDESKILPVYMDRNNQLAIEDIALAINKAYGSLVEKDEKVFFMGGCDIRGPEGYNDTLGMERGKSVMMAVASLLNKKYGMSHEKLKGLLRYGSLGKRQPQFDEHLLNRRVDVVKGSDLIVEYAHLPPPPYVTKQ